MIGSTLSRMTAAEQLSIPQLQRAIQDGTVPAYVGIPILQDKVKQGQQAKMAQAGQGGPKPTVANQVMQQASQEEMGGIDQIPTEAPAMAGGGIIAFADGDLVDNESSDNTDATGWSDEEKQLLGQYQQMGDFYADQGPGGLSYQDVAGGQLQAGKKIGAYKGITGDHKYKDMIKADAIKQGLDPEYALKIAMIETGGLKNPETARSKAGAIGIMQLMPATAKSLGVNPEIPEENIHGGNTLLKRLVDKYGDYDLAGAAYNAGEGRVDRALRSGDLGSLSSETQGYMGKIRGYADGGIAHFADGDYIDPSMSDAGPGDSGQNVSVSDWLASRRAIGYGLPESTAEAIKVNPDVGAYWGQYGQQLLQSPDLAAFNKDPRGYVKGKQAQYAKEHPAKQEVTQVPNTGSTQGANDKSNVPPVVQEPTAPAGITSGTDYSKDLYSRLTSMIDQSAKDRESDKWMSLMAAGLGMMGGTSPYAAANIGQGAMQGIQAQLAAQKQQGEQDKLITSGMLGLTRDQAIEKQRQDMLQYRRDALKQQGIYKDQELGIQQGTLAERQRENAIRAQTLRSNVAKNWMGSPEDMAMQKDLTARFGKNWNTPNSEAAGLYARAQNRWIDNRLASGDTGENAQDATALLAKQQ